MSCPKTLPLIRPQQKVIQRVLYDHLSVSNLCSAESQKRVLICVYNQDSPINARKKSLCYVECFDTLHLFVVRDDEVSNS